MRIKNIGLVNLGVSKNGIWNVSLNESALYWDICSSLVAFERLWNFADFYIAQKKGKTISISGGQNTLITLQKIPQAIFSG